MQTSSEKTDLDFDTEVARFTPRQQQAVDVMDRANGKYILYGGALGGGKSYWLRWVCVRYLMQVYATKHKRWVQAMLACEDYPTLKDRQVIQIERQFPTWLGRSYTDHKVYGRCFILSPRYGNGVICLRNLDDASKYASSEFALIAVDELTKNLLSVFNDLRTRNRWTGLTDMECKFIAGTNPGSVGHGWTKNLWMNRSFPEEYYPPMSPVDYRPTFHYIPSKADDNPHLDPSYWSMLATLPKAIRKAFRDGDWNTFIGQAFQEWDPNIHVCKPFPVPENAPIYFTMDWGFGAPFAMEWWWVDNDGRIYLFHERYGWTGESNIGLRLSDDELAGMLLQEEELAGINSAQVIKRLAGRDCFAKRPNPFGGGQGPATNTVFAKYKDQSGRMLRLYPGDPSRVLKKRQFHNRLAIPSDGTRPMMQVYSTCEQFIRTIPDLVVDPNNIEDIETKGEDHIFDSACHVMMARPISVIGRATHLEEETVKAPVTLTDMAALEREMIFKGLEEENERDVQAFAEAIGW